MIISLRGSQELREVDFVSSCCLPAWDQTLTKPVARKDSSKANQPRDGINIRELWSERPFTNSPQFGALSYYFQQIFETIWSVVTQACLVTHYAKKYHNKTKSIKDVENYSKEKDQ